MNCWVHPPARLSEGECHLPVAVHIKRMSWRKGLLSLCLLALLTHWRLHPLYLEFIYPVAISLYWLWSFISLSLCDLKKSSRPSMQDWDYIQLCRLRPGLQLGRVRHPWLGYMEQPWLSHTANFEDLCSGEPWLMHQAFFNLHENINVKVLDSQ